MNTSSGFVSCQYLLNAHERPLFLATNAIGTQSAQVDSRKNRPRVGDARASVAVTGDTDAAGIEQRDPFLLKGAVAGVAPCDLLPSDPQMLLTKPAPHSPPG